MRRFIIPLALSAFALTACQQPAAPPQSDTSPAAVPAQATAAATIPTAPATSPDIPERFRGIWDSAEGNCRPASELRLVIGAVSVEFYESLGTVHGVTVESLESIVVDLAMEGEGERWTRKTRFVLSDGGATLTPSETGGPSAAAVPLKRC